MKKLNKLPTETEIKYNWQSAEVRVTCYVQCYNQEAYIEDALVGILRQKTDFAFKIVVYDDASTDATQSIIKSYEDSYPSLIFPYFADFNHKKEIPRVEHEDMVEGIYVAFCEGDDYWTDEYKLQTQHDIMERSECQICIHPAVILFEKTGTEDIFCYYGENEAIINKRLVFELKNQFAPTASYFISKECYCIFMDFLKKRRPGFGDFFIEAFSSKNGVLYTPRLMSVYRRGTEGSDSAKLSTMSAEELEESYSNHFYNLHLLEEIRPELSELIRTREKVLRAGCLIEMLAKKEIDKKEKNSYEEEVKALASQLGDLSPSGYIYPLNI